MFAATEFLMLVDIYTRFEVQIVQYRQSGSIWQHLEFNRQLPTIG